MKKIILFISIFILTPLIHAQSTQHLNFKGVPINGTLNEFVTIMKSNGFIHAQTTDDGIAMLTGDFAGYKECIIGVPTLKQKDLVYKTIVLLPEIVSGPKNRTG